MSAVKANYPFLRATLMSRDQPWLLLQFVRRGRVARRYGARKHHRLLQSDRSLARVLRPGRSAVSRPQPAIWCVCYAMPLQPIEPAKNK